MAITKTDVHKLARLSRLKLTDAEEAAAVDSINAVLAMLDDLRRAPVDDVGDFAYVQGGGMSLRSREPTAKDGFASDELLCNAPHSSDGFFLVPKVVE